MKKQLLSVATILLMATTSLYAQKFVSAPIYGYGKQNQIPMFTGSATIADSKISQSLSNIEVKTNLRVYGDAGNGLQMQLDDIFSAGGKNLLVGNDAYFSDVDLANTLGLYGNQDNTTGGLKLGSASPVLFGKNGNVGLGSTTPTSFFTLYGDSKNLEISNTNETNAGIVFTDAQATTAQFAKILFNSGNHALSFHINNNSPNMVLTPGGSLGVGLPAGTSSPREAFQLGSDFVIHNGGTKVIARNWDYTYVNNAWKSVRMVDGVSAGISIGQTGIINLWNAPTGVQGSEIATNTRLSITADGKVGIGTASPVEQLDVNGNIRIRGNSPDGEGSITVLEQNTTSNQGLSIGANNSEVYIAHSYSNSGVPFNFKHGTTDVMTIKNSSVGIGTSTMGSHKLAVEGSIGAREVVVEAGTWSDFVFADDYKLKSLQEVENYIQENKHLPDVPSEKEVMETGISLGEMDAVLLQKIEELTLYTIEQQKVMEKQQELIEALQKRLEELER